MQRSSLKRWLPDVGHQEATCKGRADQSDKLDVRTDVRPVVRAVRTDVRPVDVLALDAFAQVAERVVGDLVLERTGHYRCPAPSQRQGNRGWALGGETAPFRVGLYTRSCSHRGGGGNTLQRGRG